MLLSGNYDLYVIEKTNNYEDLNNPLKLYCKNEGINFNFFKYLINLLK